MFGSNNKTFLGTHGERVFALYVLSSHVGMSVPVGLTLIVILCGLLCIERRIYYRILPQ